MKILRRTLLVLASIILLITLFYAVEGLRGMRVWRKTKADLEAKGERFDWKSLAPPAVPDAENFAMTPLLAPLFDVVPDPAAKPGTPSVKPRDQAAFVILSSRLNNLSLAGRDQPPAVSWRLGQITDLAAWQAHYRTSTTFPTNPIPGQPGADVLLALSKFDPEMNELRFAARRPHSRFSVRYEDNFAVSIPHLHALHKFSRISGLQALAHLSLGQADAALDDVRLGFRFADSVSTERLLISGLIQSAMVELTLQPVWEGLAGRHWSDVQLAALEKQLAAFDVLAAYPRAIRSEQVSAINTIDFIRDNPRSAAALFIGYQLESGSASLALAPYGWFDQNKAFIVNLHQEYSLPLLDLEKRLFRFDIYARARAYEPELNTRHPYRILAGILFPSVLNAAQRYAQSQSAIDLARIACALERHRLKHGTFPETTAALVPEFLPKLPHDVMSGTALQYRRIADGKFILYSVGFNQTDDGGEVVLGPGNLPSADPKRGDWVWSYDEKPAKP